jgi:hypothetical protein
MSTAGLGRGNRSWATTVGAALAVVFALVVGACTPPPNDAGSPPTTIDPLPGPPGNFSLLSYNVAGLPQEVSSVNPQQHIPLISPLLDEYDVVLTQEDFDWWVPLAGLLDFANYHTRLRADSTHPYRSARHPGPGAVGVDPSLRPLLVGDGIGFLSRYPLLGERHGAWRGCHGGIIPDGGAGDCLAMKGFRSVTVVLGDGNEVDVYNLHAEAGGTPIDQMLQEENYEQLAAAIESRSAGRTVIVAGDTNLHIGAHRDGGGGADALIWSRFLDRLGLTDVCAELSCDEPESIDKVAYRSAGGLVLSPTSHTFARSRFTSPSGAQLSDHPPLVVHFDWDLDQD